MKYFLLIAFLITGPLLKAKDCTTYHQHIQKIESYIADKDFYQAFSAYQKLFNDYEFVFLRDQKNALQLAGYLNLEDGVKELLQATIKNGLTEKLIRKNKWTRKAYRSNVISKELYQNLVAAHKSSLMVSLRDKIKVMHRKDQWKAFGALLRIGSPAQDRYAERKFAPQSIVHVNRIAKIILRFGYPGEKLIGNDYWVSGMLSHHNSVSQAFVSEDTLYDSMIKPYLSHELKLGNISPQEIAIIEDWKEAVLTGHSRSNYGFLGSFWEKDLERINENRDRIGLRSIVLRNRLVEIEKEYGFDLGLPGEAWHKGQIRVSTK